MKTLEIVSTGVELFSRPGICEESIDSGAKSRSRNGDMEESGWNLKGTVTVESARIERRFMDAV